MLTLTLWLISATAYVLIGVIHARWIAVDLYRRHGGFDVESDLLLYCIFWPLTMAYGVMSAIVDALSRVLMKPIRVRQERVEQLYRDAKAWKLKQYESNSPEEIKMARELEKFCRELAKQLEI